VALLAGIAIVATEFPLGQLMRGRAALGQTTQQLTQLQAQNRALARQVSDLRQNGTIARIAHQDYGLISRGQRSVVVLPSATTKTGGASGPLSTTKVPKSDLVPSDAIVSPSGGRVRAVKRAGFWSRLVQRLEFWKAVP
jgi:hypothetical protein